MKVEVEIPGNALRPYINEEELADRIAEGLSDKILMTSPERVYIDQIDIPLYRDGTKHDIRDVLNPYNYYDKDKNLLKERFEAYGALLNSLGFKVVVGKETDRGLIRVAFDEPIENPIRLLVALCDTHHSTTKVELSASKSRVLYFGVCVLADYYYGPKSGSYNKVNGYLEHNLKLLTEFFKGNQNKFIAYFHRSGKMPKDPIEVIKI